jgi:hypothetical protein
MTPVGCLSLVSYPAALIPNLGRMLQKAGDS